MTDKSENPVFFEVFTEMSSDADFIKEFYDLSRPKDLRSEIMRKGKEFAKCVIGQDKAQKIINIIKK